MIIFKVNRDTKSFTVKRITRNVQVNRVGKRGLPGEQGPKGDPGDPASNLVTSVNGKQGVVVINKSDVGLSNVPNTDFTAAVASNTAKRSYPLVDEQKLSTIASGAEVNVNADWNAVSGDAQILNKPTIPVLPGNIVQSVTAGANVTVDNTDPANPIVSSTGGGGGAVSSVNGRTGAVTGLAEKAELDMVENELFQDLTDGDAATLSSANSYTDSEISAIDFPVDSVAGKTGTVTLNKSDVGLSNVDNTSDLNKPISTATQSALDAKYDSSNNALAAIAGTTPAANFIPYYTGTNTGNTVGFSSFMRTLTPIGSAATFRSGIGLGNVDNTSDANKPVSSAQQTALDGKENTFSKGSLIQGSNVTLTGTLTDRLVGAGDITISATGGGGGGSGDVTGPTSSTDNGIARFDSTTGKIIQDSSVKVTDAGAVNFPSISAPSHSQGDLYYDTAEDDLVWHNSRSSVSLNIGSEQRVLVMNTSGVTITNGIPVRYAGQLGGVPLVVPAVATNSALSQVVGLTTESIANNATGYVATFGKVRNINTSAFAAGVSLYLGSSAGTMVTGMPTPPSKVVKIGNVLVSNATTGVIQLDLIKPDILSPSAGTTEIGTVIEQAGLRSSGAYTITTSGTVTLSGGLVLSGSYRETPGTQTASTGMSTNDRKNMRISASTAAINITLPNTTVAGTIFRFLRVDATAQVVTLIGTFNGSTNYVLSAQYKYVHVMSTTVSGQWDIWSNN